MNPLEPSAARMRASKSSGPVEASTVWRNVAPSPGPTAASKATTTSWNGRVLTCSQWIRVLSSCIIGLDDYGMDRSQEAGTRIAHALAVGLSLKAGHLKRYKDIALLLLKYGRSDLVKSAGLDSALGDEPRSAPGSTNGSAGIELAADLERLGPT